MSMIYYLVSAELFLKHLTLYNIIKYTDLVFENKLKRAQAFV